MEEINNDGYLLSLNLDMAKLLLEGLDNLPADKKTNIIYTRLKDNLKTIVIIWERKIKNEKIIKQLRKEKKTKS